MGGILGAATGLVDDLIGTDFTGKKGAAAAKGATDAQVALQKQAMKQFEPFLEGGKKVLPGMIEQALSNPLESSQFKQQQQGLMDAINSSAASSGLMRSGAREGMLAAGNQGLISNAYQQQQNLRNNLLNIGTGAAAQNSNILQNQGNTMAQGILGAHNAQQAGINNLLNTGITAAAMFSDPRLKNEIKKTSGTSHPKIHRYEWQWSSEAEKLGLNGSDHGYMAHEVKEVYPDLVHRDGSGYDKINVKELEKRLAA